MMGRHDDDGDDDLTVVMRQLRSRHYRVVETNSTPRDELSSKQHSPLPEQDTREGTHSDTAEDTTTLRLVDNAQGWSKRAADVAPVEVRSKHHSPLPE